MAFPETNTPKRDPYGNPSRDPTGTDPQSHNNWSWYIGLAVAALIGFFLFGSMSRAPNSVSDTPALQTTAPKTVPAPTAPVVPVAPVVPAVPTP